MKKGHFAFLVVIAFVAGLAGAFVFPKKLGGETSLTSTSSHEDAYERVIRTGTIRCGYVLWTPFMIKDANSGKLSGLFYDYTQALGQALNLKIEWTEEMGWADFPAALNSGRIDAMCGGSWANSNRAREIDFVRPILYQQTFAWTRARDTRFDNNLDAINDPSIKVIYVEGSTQSVIADHDFPKSQHMPLPELTSLADTLVSLADGKADVALVPAEAGYEYTLNNPGKVRQIEVKLPLRIFGNSLAVPGGEERLRRMLDNSTNELLASGQIDKMIGNYGKITETWLRVAPPYQTESSH